MTLRIKLFFLHKTRLISYGLAGSTGGYTVVSRACGKSALDGNVIMANTQKVHGENEWDFHLVKPKCWVLSLVHI